MKPKFPFIDLATQYQQYRTAIDAAIARVFEHGQFILGKEVANFEQQLQKYVGVKHAIGCSSGTDALLLALMVAKVGRGDEVIIPSFTFVASAEVVALLGATPIFVDVDSQSACSEAEHIATEITEKTKAIICVNLFGRCPDYAAIRAVTKAAARDIVLIEDAAQSFGARQTDSCGIQHMSGTLADIGCTSFFPAKPLGCYGDGGAVFTNDDAITVALRQLLNHGQDAQYSYAKIGINGRIDALQAAILGVKLQYFETELAVRRQRAGLYVEYLPKWLKPLGYLPNDEHVFAQFTVTYPQRNQLQQHLQHLGIPTAIYYPQPLHTQSAYLPISRSKSLPNTDALAATVLSLPMSAFITEEQLEQVVTAVLQFSR